MGSNKQQKQATEGGREMTGRGGDCRGPADWVEDWLFLCALNKKPADG